jgi:beta-lactamase superfamily II metal-dependent hydrolase
VSDRLPEGDSIKLVDVLLISHADSDHVGDAQDLLLDDDIKVGVVCYNSDASKQSRVWQAFRKAIKEGRREKNLVAHAQLTSTQTGALDCGVVNVEVLYPHPETAASGPGGMDEDGKPLTSNSMSAVIRLKTAKGPMVMLAGDVQPSCLDAWREEKVDPEASVLVFPHHGGRPGDNDPVEFATEFVKAVKPKTVIFSIHRSWYSLPREDVVAAVRQHAPGVRVVCTQLSKHCSASTPAAPGSHLNQLLAHGKRENACCAGTIVIDLAGDVPVISPPAEQHFAFINTLSGEPLCIK